MRYLTLAALATGLLWVGGGVALASDTIRLGGPSAQATIQGGTDTELVRWRHHGHHGYGYGHYNYRPYYSSSYYAQPYYYYPRSYAYSYNYYAPTYYPSTYYYRPSYSYYRSAYHHHHYNRRIAGDDVATPTVTLQGIPNTPAQTQSPSNGTFQYNGDPTARFRCPRPARTPTPRTVHAGSSLSMADWCRCPRK